MSDKPRDRDPLLSGWVKALLAVAALLLLAVGVVALLGVISTNRWHRYAAELRAGGDPLTFEEIEAQRATIPEEQNGARVIERLADELRAVSGASSQKEHRKLLLAFNRSAPGTDFFNGIDRPRIQPSRTFLERHRNILNELAALRDKPRGRFDIPQRRTANSADLAFHTLYARIAAKLFVLDATMRLIDGQVNSAVDTATLLFHLAGTLNDEPGILGRLSQLTAEDAALRTVESILRVDELNVDSLVTLSANIDDRLASSTFKWAILGERAHLLAMCDKDVREGITMQSVDFSLSHDIDTIKSIPTVLVRMNQRRIAEVCTWMVDACDDPKAMTAAARRMETVRTSAGLPNFLVGILLPSLSRMVELHWSTIAGLRCAGAGLAAERFRLRSGRFPDSMDAMVPQYLHAVPNDPFAQEPIRLAVHEDGIVIYSVGPDRTDDSGDVAKDERRNHPSDRGFRLLKPHLRGLVILDDTAESD